VTATSTTAWEYVWALALGENDASIIARDGAGNESAAVEVSITHTVVTPTAGVCTSYVYGDWGACANGKQARTVTSATPSGCDQATAVLERTCAAPAPADDTVKREQGMVKAMDAQLVKRLRGRILLQIESKGEGWYVSPVDGKKYYLGRPADAFALMRRFGLGVRHSVITAGKFGPNLAGRILIDVDDLGKAYYINPVDNKPHYLGRPADAFRVMRESGLGINNANIRKINVGE
jgi:hypothetical protein